MTGQHRSGFSPSQAGDAMWDAMQQFRSGLDRKVGTRMGRGDVRTAILALLNEEPMHGYQIIQEIGARTEGRWKPSAGSVYPTLQLLADEGVIEAQPSADRKVYALTEAGRDEAATAVLQAPWAKEESREAGPFGPLPKAGFDLAQAVTQVVRSGSTAQQEKAVEVLDQARRKIYTILAED